MPRQGLNRENVIDAAIKLIEEKGYSNFSINELAKSLNVRPASLYNHIVNIDEIFSETAARANSMMIEAEEKASKGKIRDEALLAIADAYRDFARSHYELYKVVFNLQNSRSDFMRKEEVGRTIAPIMEALSAYRLNETQKRHWQRTLRSVMHGFVAHEEAGGFAYIGTPRDESYRVAIRCVIDGINKEDAGR